MFSARSEATIAECGYCSYAGDIQTPTEIEELGRISWNRKGVLCVRIRTQLCLGIIEKVIKFI